MGHGAGATILAGCRAGNNVRMRHGPTMATCAVRGEMKTLRDEFGGKTNHIHTEVGGLRERVARLEGLLEDLREAITGRKVA